MNNQIKVTYVAKTRRLMMKCPFHLADVAREFPSRRFKPKTKDWEIPLTRQNIKHLENSARTYEYSIDPEAEVAIRDFEAIIAAPKVVPFPYHLYDFKAASKPFDPMPHQRRMLDRAWNFPAIAWFAKMGTGKTFAAIHLACARYKAGLIDSVAIICPSTLRKTWEKEFKKYATVEYDFVSHETKSKKYAEMVKDRSSGVLQVVAISVEGLGISESSYDSVCEFFIKREVFLVVDESSRIKNPTANRTKRVHEFTAASKFRIILNGTPIAIGMQDLWAQYEFLDPNIIGCGDYWSFKTRYIEMGGYENKQIVGYKKVEELMRLIEPYTVEVSKDVLDLPPKVFKVRYVSATPEQKALLKNIKKGYGEEEDSPLIKVDNVLERVLRWRQVVGGWLPRQDPLTGEVTLEPLKKNPKMEDLFSTIADHRAGSKFIIWSTFVHEIDFIADKLGEIYGKNSVRKYYGDTDKTERSAIEDAYCNDPDMCFFVGNPATAGLGLTLISGVHDIMVYYSGTNAFIDRTQSEDRSHRIGQEHTVTIVDMVMENTVDELVIESTEQKMDVETYIMQRLAAGEQLTLEG